MGLIKILALIFFFDVSFASSFDLEKTQEAINECLRISRWGLLSSSPPLSIKCQEDHQLFMPQSSSLAPQVSMRIGSFNLLHPGTGKTLFKDLKIIAKLINQDFDLLSGLELMAVVSENKERNLRISPNLEKKFNDLSEIIKALEFTNKRKVELEELKRNSINEEELKKILARIEEIKNQLKSNQKILEEKKTEIQVARLEVQRYMKPGFVFFGIEFFKKGRLRKLEASRQKLMQMENLLRELEERKNTLTADLTLKEKEYELARQTSFFSPQLAQELEQVLTTLETQKNEKNQREEEFKKQTLNYQIPAYLKLLNELRELDPSWGFILSPHGDAADEKNSLELVGYYFRSAVVTPTANLHCSKKFQRESFGCYPTLDESYMGRDVTDFFSRRPFLATFKTSKSEFTMISSHVIFTSPTDPGEMSRLLGGVFGISSPTALGTGMNRQNYARFAEVALTLELINKLKEEGIKRIIYAGDLNLESSNKFWGYIFQKYPGYKLLIHEKTTLTGARFSKGIETQGLASNYDHFILSESEARICSNGSAINFMTNPISALIHQNYLIRNPAPSAPYTAKANAELIMNERNLELKNRLVFNNFKVSSSGIITPDSAGLSEDLLKFKERVFDSQFSDETYYNFYSQIISDHLPIKIECAI